MDTYLMTSDVARVLGVTPATVRWLRRKGRLQNAARTEGGIRLFKRTDVDDLASRRAMKKARRAR